MVNEADMQKFDEFRFAVTKRWFDDCGGISAIEERPLLYTSFMQTTPEDVPVYTYVPSYDVSAKRHRSSARLSGLPACHLGSWVLSLTLALTEPRLGPLNWVYAAA
jgi:hypothetical protein